MKVAFSRRLGVAFVVALIATLIFYASYFQPNPDAYLFPVILASLILVFSLISLLREAFDWCLDDFRPFPFMRQWPIILILVAAVSLIEVLGMYTTALLTLFVVSLGYSPEPNKQRRIIHSLLFAVGFTGFMYMLFSLMLGVQLPRGLWI